MYVGYAPTQYTYEQKKGNTLKLCYYPKTMLYYSNIFSELFCFFYLNNNIAGKLKKEVQKSKSQNIPN